MDIPAQKGILEIFRDARLAELPFDEFEPTIRRHAPSAFQP